MLICDSKDISAHTQDLMYRKMDVARECISPILELREMLLSFQTGFNLVNAAVIFAILESNSSSELLSDTAEPRYFKLVRM